MSKIAKLVMCMLVVFVSSLAVLNPQSALAKPRETKQAKEEVVYATKRGKKFHKEECRFIRDRDTIGMSKENAEIKGLEPCGRCSREEE